MTARTGMSVGREVGAVKQAVSILRTLADGHDPMGVTAVARASGVSASTALNILRTLVDAGLVGFEPSTKTYRLDLGLLELSRSLLNKSNIDLLHPDLQRVTVQFEGTASIWQLSDMRRLILVKRIVPETAAHIEFPIASRIPAFAGALGRAVAVALDASRDDLEAGFMKIRWNSPMTFEKYLEDLEAVRRDGYSIDVGQLIRSVTTVAAAICDRDGQPRLALATHTFQGQLGSQDLERLGEELKSICAKAQRSLFGG